MKVCKFGGTSLASAEQIKKVCEITLSDPERRIIVVSAPGKRFPDDTKVTDLLIAAAEAFLRNSSASAEMQLVIDRYMEICDDLGLGSEIKEIITEDLKSLLKLDTSDSQRFMDAMKAAGEDNIAKVVAAYLHSLNNSAFYVNPKAAGLLLSNEFGNARVLPVSFPNLHAYFSDKGKEEIFVFPGFFGYSHDGSVVTFSRGGSDITGSILAASVGASVYENFTDVDSVYAANPKVISNPVAIKEITYREMRELSYAGFSVLHEETLSPVYKAGIAVNIRNTNNPDAPGTMILPTKKITDRIVTGIAGDADFCTVYVSKYLMNREIGFGRKLLQIFEEHGISYEHTPSGIDDISVIVRKNSLTPEIESTIVERIKKELVVDSISVSHNDALIIVAGEGMRDSLGVLAKVTTALSAAKINIEMVNQGSSEISIMIGVKGDDCNDAINAIYNAFFS